MASILKFVARAARVRRRTPVEGDVERACEIVIFPGVRREPLEQGGDKPTPRPKRGRRRRVRSS